MPTEPPPAADIGIMPTAERVARPVRIRVGRKMQTAAPGLAQHPVERDVGQPAIAIAAADVAVHPREPDLMYRLVGFGLGP